MQLKTLETHRRHATTASGPVSYLDVGHGRAAVFIHGLLTNSLLWRHVIATVASEQRRCIAVDLPGHGHTPMADEHADVSLSGLARRIIELIDHLGLDRFDLVADDTGGAVAQIVAAHAGERLSTLTLTHCDTEGNTPPLLFKPVTLLVRLGLLTRMGPYVAARRGACDKCWQSDTNTHAGYLTRWSTLTATRSWAHQNPRAPWPASSQLCHRTTSRRSDPNSLT